MINSISLTDDSLIQIMEELILREPIFHRLELGTSREALEDMTAEDFWEVGASGQIYSRSDVIESLLERYKNLSSDIWETKDFHCRKIAPDNYLLTYTLIQDKTRITRRSTLWRKCKNQWKIVYHQGTIVQDNQLGLPIEYQQMPELFDAHNINEQTEAKNALIEQLLKEQKINTVLDLTCGTGSQVFYLNARGYRVVGSDFSPALLVIAREKAKAIKADITFIDGDMRNIQVGKFDAVITIFNAIGHLTTSDFEKALRNIHSNLSDNGIYIFDICNLQAITDNMIDDFTMNIKSMINGVEFHNNQYSEIDRAQGLLTSHDQYTMSNDTGESEIRTNTFSLQIYTVDALNVLLEKNGFEVIKQYDMDGNDFVEESSVSILTVARRQSR